MHRSMLCASLFINDALEAEETGFKLNRPEKMCSKDESCSEAAWTAWGRQRAAVSASSQLINVPWHACKLVAASKA